MTARGKIIAMVFSTAVAAIATPAEARDFFSFFSGFFHHHRSAPPDMTSSFADPNGDQGNTPRGDTSPASGYCVRTCDGHYFPVRAQGNVSSAQMCRAFCPAAQTIVYSGGGDIENSVAGNGSRYADMPNAFLYRKQLVDGCTCNGRTPYGLATIDVQSDPTLRPGDIVATTSGLSTYSNARNRTADFTPIGNDRATPTKLREQLANTRIMPPNPGAPEMKPVSLSAAAAPPTDEASNADDASKALAYSPPGRHSRYRRGVFQHGERLSGSMP
ncbi:MAG: DUF2865 domain-containing protein [Pseudolabrys sp.]|nr:DUF2865 domain-containing protein [Pseudolabrys sp.]